MGSGHTLGERGGEQAHTLSIGELPTHVHVANATTAQADQNSNSAAPTRSNFSQLYGAPNNLAPMTQNALTNHGGSQAHLNMEPFLVLSFCIALQGIFPSQN
jgi:microcystin-dependent protein